MPTFDLVVRILGTLLALCLVLVLAWLLLRWMNRRMPGLGGGAKRAIKVIDRVTVGKNNTVLLLRVKDKVMLVAVNDHAIEKLYEFDDPDGEMDLPPPGENPSFTSAFKDAVKKLGRPKDGGDGP